jgi:NDP-hexose-3-ketoreductase
VNIGILGTANIARKYTVDTLKRSKHVDNIFISSRDPNKAKEFADEFNISHKESYDEIINSRDIQAVYIPLPIGLHEEWVIKAAKKKKHIICEKSLSDNLESVKNMIDECKKNKVVLFENFMCDYHPQHKKVCDLIREIGTPIVLRAYFGYPPVAKQDFKYNKELGGGSLNDAGAYTLFIARKFFGEPISITSNLDIDQKTEVDIRGSAFLEFPENKIAFLSFGMDNVYQNNYSIWGSSGVITVDRAFAIPPDLKPPVTLYKNENLQSKTIVVDIEPANQFDMIFEDFFDKIKSQKFEYDKILAQAISMQSIRKSFEKKEKILVSKPV